MKRSFSLIALAALLALLATGASFAQMEQWRVDWWTVDGGDGASAGGEYAITGATIGQPDAGQLTSAGGEYRLHGGFWGTGQGAEQPVFLPLVSK